MSKGVHNIAFYVSPDPECSRTTQNPEISIAPSRGRILYAIYGNRTCVISHIVVTAIDKKYRNYYISTKGMGSSTSYASFGNKYNQLQLVEKSKGNWLRRKAEMTYPMVRHPGLHVELKFRSSSKSSSIHPYTSELTHDEDRPSDISSDCITQICP